MRHLRRHYFDNYGSDSASDQFVAMIDQGRDALGAPRYAVVVGTMLSPSEILFAAQALLAAPCFFKLPVGATAIVDIYIPDSDESDEPKTFDYQVFKAKLTLQESEESVQTVGQMHEMLSQLMKDEEVKASGLTKQSGATVSASGPFGGTGATGAACYLASSGPSGPSNPCGGQSGIACPDPITTVAACVNGMLRCVVPEPPGDNKQQEGRKHSK